MTQPFIGRVRFVRRLLVAVGRVRDDLEGGCGCALLAAGETRGEEVLRRLWCRLGDLQALRRGLCGA
jgi:hypothetical protein